VKVTSLWVLSLLVLVGLFMTGVASGQTPPGNATVTVPLPGVPAGSPLAGILQELLVALASLVCAVVTYGVTRLTQKYAAKSTAETTATDDASLRQLALEAVFYAQEWEAKQVKTFALQKVPFEVSGSQKLREAITYMVSRRPTLTNESATQIIHATLGTVRGLGASASFGLVNGTDKPA